jgi:outer membrane protein assembly factor BamB
MRTPTSSRRRRAAVTVTAAAAAVAAALTAAVCSAAPARGAVTSPGTTIAGCHTGVWAQEFTDAGHRTWQVSLPVTASTGDAGTLNGSVAPLVVGGLAVFTDGNSLYALRLSDGRPVWHRQLGPHPTQASDSDTGAVGQLWLWHGAVIALTGENSKAPALVALDPATGAVRWRTVLGSGPLEVDTLPVTTGGIAVANTGKQGTTLTAVDLSDGKRLWTRGYGRTPLVQASGANLVVSTRTSDTAPVALTGLRGRDGAALWSRAGFPGWISVLPAPGGRVLLDGANATPAPGAAAYPLTALSAATGRTLWQVRPAAQVTAVWATMAGVVIATGTPGRDYAADPAARLYLASLTTGKVRWSAPGHTDPETTALITPGEVVTVATTPSTGAVIARSARTGAVRWKAPITDAYGRYLAQPAGPDLLVAFPGASLGQPSRLLSLDTATGATRATDPLPFTSTVGAPLTVAGRDALTEPLTTSCAAPVHP